MSRFDLRHPDDGLLLRYLDGELSGRKARQVREHLEACWQCRADVEQLQATISQSVRYRKDVLGALPAPPAEWSRLDFESVDAELAAESFWARLSRLFSPRQNAPIRWALSGAAALALALLAIHQLRETPKVEAAALLKKAVAVADARPHTSRRLRITTAHKQLTHLVGSPVQLAADEREIAALFHAAHYDFDDPLSARAYSGWRGQLAAYQDQVETSDPNVYTITTTTPDGALRSATLKLRSSDLEPVEGRFEFRDSQWVEMTELVGQQTLPASTVAGTTGGMPRQPGMPPVPEAVAPEAPEPPGFAEEVQVYSALHQVGADLGDPIEVSRSGGEIVVSGNGVSPQHQQKIHNLLDRLPHVAVRFSEPSFPASSQPAPEPATRDAASPEKPKYPARLEQRLGGRPQFERFSGQVMDWSEAVMARVYALHNLAQQFPAEKETALRPEERRTLRAIGADHINALKTDLQKLVRTVNPVLTDIGARASVPTPSLAESWQPASDQLFASGRRMETLLASVLGMTPDSAPAEDASSQLLTVLGQFTSATEHCLRLLSYDDVRQSK
jgi:anti-sigma factor RsiW